MITQPSHEKASNGATGEKMKKNAQGAPLGLNQEYRKKNRHYISNCDISDKDTKATLLEEYRRSRRAICENSTNESGRTTRSIDARSYPHSSVSRTAVAKDAIHTHVMTDECADADFISAKMMKKIDEKMVNLLNLRLKATLICKGVIGEPCMTCEESFNTDVYLHVGRVSSLILRNINYKITKEKSSTPILGRRVLESL